MNDKSDKTSIHSLAFFTKKTLIVFVIFTIGILMLWLTKSIVNLLLILFGSILFSILLLGLSRKLSEKTPIKEGWSLLVVFLSIVLLLGLAGWIIGPSIASQTEQLSERFPESLSEAKNQLSQYEWGANIAQQIPDDENLMNEAGKYSSKIFSVFSTTLGVVVDLVVFLVFSLFIATNPSMYSQGFLKLLPKATRPRGQEVLAALNHNLFRWFSGRLLDMLIVGIVTGLGLWFLGIPLALTFGLITALLNFIPNLGPILAALPPVLLGLAESPAKALQVALLFLIIQLLESYFLIPQIQKRATSMPPVMLLLAQIALAGILGVLGLLLATPLMVVLLVIIKMVYVEDVLKDRSIEVKGEKSS